MSHDIRSALRFCSLFALLVLGACGSSAPAKSGQAGGGGHAGAGGVTASGGAGGLGICAGASGCPGPVGPEGATLTQGDVVLTVPPDALATEEMITVQTTMAPAGYQVTSAAYQFLPSGTTFAKPVTVSIVMTLPTPEAHIFWSNASGGFDDIGGTVAGNVITGQVTHFSIGFAAVPAKVDGGAPDVAATGSDASASVDATASADAGGAGAGGAVGDAAVTSTNDAAAGADASASIDATASADAGGVAGASGGGTDAGAGVDAASLCASFALNAPVFQPTLVTDGGTAPASSTYTGGAIPSGQLYLEGVTHYGSAYGGPRQEVLIYDATARTLRIVDRVPNAQSLFYVGLENVTNADAHTLVGDVVCSTYPNQLTPLSWSYSVAGTTLTMSPVGSSDVMTYILPASF